MLTKQEILKQEEGQLIEKTLKEILNEVENGTLEIDENFEDIHSFVESTLIDRIGDTGKKLHTGRSRNDQVALDMRLYTKDQIEMLNTLLVDLLKTIHEIMKEQDRKSVV